MSNQQSFAVFTMDATTKRWWQRWIKKPFWHVVLVHAWVQNDRHYIRIVDPIVEISKCLVTIRSNSIHEVVHWYSYLRTYRELCMQRSGGIPPKVLKLNIFLDKYNCVHKLLSRMPLCTTYIARRLKVASYAITPFQVYKVLRKKGCKQLF